jgi:predicted acyltransferase
MIAVRFPYIRKKRASTNMTSHPMANAKPDRITSLDQFRGYTVVGMLLVNYFGGFAVCPQVLKHTHDYCSYADTIMPQFLFAVGFALRLTFGRRMQTQGSAAAYGRMIRRLLGLVLVAIVVYHVGPRAANWEKFTSGGVWETLYRALYEPMKRGWFQTLMHIAVTSLWILPVVHCRASTRIWWMIGSAILHVVLSYWFNFVWVNTDPNGIDGGPLGFLTWAVPAIVGTLACDVFVQPRTSMKLTQTLTGVFAASLLLMLVGYGISCGTRMYDVPAENVESLKKVKLARDPVVPRWQRIQSKEGPIGDWLAEPPFVKPPTSEYRKWNYWMMSQRGGTLSYLVFSAGFSLFVFLLFYVVCDLAGLQLPFFRTFGTNALIAYILHSMVSGAIQPFVPKDSPAWYAYSALALFFFINWLFIRQLEKQNIYFRV